MSDSLFSPYWYRAAGLHPRLISTIQVARQTFRGEHWHVLSNPATGRQFRVNSIAYQLVGRLDGRLTVQEIWNLLVRELGNDAPTQHEVLSVLSELAAAGMLHSETAQDLGAVFEATRRRRGRPGKQQGLLGFRVSLFDPTPVLDALLPLTTPLLRPAMLFVWGLLMLVALLVAGMHAAELGAYAQLHLASPRMLLLGWFLYPAIKAAHELAHGLAVRRWGGEVREMGVAVFLVIPVPYVDASAASGFSSKYRRMAVSGMGILVETTLAALALFIWLQVGDGWLRQAAFACMLIGGMSTLLVNANPLMRFDGYYVLMDWLEMPGLATRADAWLRYLGERWVLGNRKLRSPPGSEHSRLLLSSFGLAALLYRILLLASMTIWLAAQQLALGLALGVWLLLRFLLQPLWRLLRLVFQHPRMAPIRLRAASSVSVLLLAVLGFVCAYPLPQVTRAMGLVWLPDEARVRSEVDGFVSEVRVGEGQLVKRGDVLLVLENPELEARRAQIASRLASKQQAYQAALLTQPATAVALGETLEALHAQLADAERELSRLVLYAPVDGRVGLGAARDLPGRYFPRGSVVANVLNPRQATVRLALPQTEVDLLRQPTHSIVVRTAEAPRHALAARLAAQEPAASYDLPSAVLGDRGGGPFATDPADANGLRTLAPFFIVDLELPGQALERIGSRAWVRLEFPPQPLAQQWLRALRQLLSAPLDSPVRPGATL